MKRETFNSLLEAMLEFNRVIYDTKVERLNKSIEKPDIAKLVSILIKL